MASDSNSMRSFASGCLASPRLARFRPVSVVGLGVTDLVRVGLVCVGVVRVGLVCVGVACVGLVGGCGGAEALSMLELDFAPLGSGAVQRAQLSERAQVDIRFTPPGGLVELSVDCLASDPATAEQPDLVGFRYTVAAPGADAGGATGFAPSDPTASRAGYWKIRDSLPAVPTRVRLLTEGGPASCEIRIAPVPSACGAREIFRSTEVGHEHVVAAAEPRAEWERFPVSGNHYASWAAWNTFYVQPIRTGYLLHDLEHGGIVFSYRCASPSESPECTATANSLMAAKTRFNQRRSIVTPDPVQPSRFAARAWRWGYLASCYDEDDLVDFATRRFRKGREDVDVDPFPSFDPSL